ERRDDDTKDTKSNDDDQIPPVEATTGVEGTATEAIIPLKVSGIIDGKQIKDGAREVIIDNGEARETGEVREL
ncbi:hypothetical protein ACLOJK_000569, partial [Asimina triloba]